MRDNVLIEFVTATLDGGVADKAQKLRLAFRAQERRGLEDSFKCCSNLIFFERYGTESLAAGLRDQRGACD